MATVAERNAAFDAVKAEALTLVKLFVPGFFEATAEAKLNAKEMVPNLLAIVDAALGAAEKVRASTPSK